MKLIVELPGFDSASPTFCDNLEKIIVAYIGVPQTCVYPALPSCDEFTRWLLAAERIDVTAYLESFKMEGKSELS